MEAVDIKISEAAARVFGDPRGSVSYRAMFGGRGSGKSYSAALVSAIWGYMEKLRILCVREFQNSIKGSFYAEVKAACEANPWLLEHYTFGRDFIRGANGTEYIFKGLHGNPQSVKSLAKIDLTIVEEAEDLTEDAWLQLEATVFRQPDSELWALWNPKNRNSPVDFRFRQHPPKSAIVECVNFDGNPFLDVRMQDLREHQLNTLDYGTYSHIWLGAYLENSDKQIFNGRWEVKEFSSAPNWDGPYQGGDFGYSQDPTAAVRCWVHDECLYIEYESGGQGIELDDIPDRCAVIPDFDKYVTRWDSAQPAMISHISRNGLPKSEGVKKGAGSVADGIAFIRSFKRVYIHPRCKNTAQEFQLYSWKVNRAGDILTEPVDAMNHWIDATRYAMEPLMRYARNDYDSWV